jgi:beta-galactosidase
MSDGLMRLGVCYYPEHWPEDWWADDARRMAEIGISRVRIGEFAWSRIEPEPGRFDWGWLDRAIEILDTAGLGIILGTPTATPPKWLVDQMPDMVALDAQGRPRGFGSRRHYCFSHLGYRGESARITREFAERYGDHPAIVQWQTDNEYGCHDTVPSYSDAALAGFQLWLAERYGSIDALNTAWGGVFWSMEFRSFDEIPLPNLTVTEPNPSHVLDFRRYSSDQVVAFNKVQAEIIRAHSPGRDVVHNYMGFFTQFDHHAVAVDLDVVSWDSYPLGFLEQFWFSTEEKARYARQGHPDIAAFHHDLYRGCTPAGRWSVMEQQPGPVNWAGYNPAPLPGMVRLWTLEAMAHGAEMVSYFRWRQAPFAQEQMHAGLLRPDRRDDVGAHEARAASADIATIGELGAPPKSVAMLFDYAGDWVTEIQPQGRGFRALRLAFEFYTGLRRLGLDVDIVPPSAALDGYQMVVIPCMPMLPEGLVDRLAAFKGPVLIGPRTGSKTQSLTIPSTLPPGDLQRLIPFKVVRVESLRPGLVEAGEGWAVHHWLEHVETQLAPRRSSHNGRGIVYTHQNITYLAGWSDGELLSDVIQALAKETTLDPMELPEDLRIRRAGGHVFAFNYGPDILSLPNITGGQIIGGNTLPPAGVAVWR